MSDIKSITRSDKKSDKKSEKKSDKKSKSSKNKISNETITEDLNEVVSKVDNLKIEQTQEKLKTKKKSQINKNVNEIVNENDENIDDIKLELEEKQKTKKKTRSNKVETDADKLKKNKKKSFDLEFNEDFDLTEIKTFFESANNNTFNNLISVLETANKTKKLPSRYFDELKLIQEIYKCGIISMYYQKLKLNKEFMTNMFSDFINMPILLINHNNEAIAKFSFVFDSNNSKSPSTIFFDSHNLETFDNKISLHKLISAEIFETDYFNKVGELPNNGLLTILFNTLSEFYYVYCLFILNILILDNVKKSQENIDIFETEDALNKYIIQNQEKIGSLNSVKVGGVNLDINILRRKKTKTTNSPGNVNLDEIQSLRESTFWDDDILGHNSNKNDSDSDNE